MDSAPAMTLAGGLPGSQARADEREIMKDKARESALIHGYGDTEAEARDDLMERGREFYGCANVEVTDYNGDPPRWYFTVVRGSSYAGATSKKLYTTGYVRAVRPHVISDTSKVYDGRAPKMERGPWLVKGTGWYWQDFTVTASSLSEAFAVAEDILKNREGIAQITSITRG